MHISSLFESKPESKNAKDFFLGISFISFVIMVFSWCNIEYLIHFLVSIYEQVWMRMVWIVSLKFISISTKHSLFINQRITVSFWSRSDRFRVKVDFLNLFDRVLNKITFLTIVTWREMNPRFKNCEFSSENWWFNILIFYFNF